MCVISDKIVFCTCETGSYEDLPHYWLLYRFNKQKDLMCVGEPMIPYDFLQLNYSINKDTLAKRLNEKDAFDKIIEFKPKDQLEIVFNNLAKAEIERMTFCFKYKGGKWVAEDYDIFELMNRYDELVFGNLEKIEAV
jgi:hypothetical protein